MKISKEVKNALKNNMPVVALESTIISHGMPYPDNIKMAKQVEEVIRKEGAIPATIAIIEGEIVVGLDDNDLKKLATAKDVLKVSKRDFGYVISQKRTGGTTVSATMILAEKAGIKVFATGGIGGAHRGVEETFDISRDLEELEQVNVLVVCAGPKAILNLDVTLEILETKGVEVIGYKTNKLPAFYSKESKLDCTYNLKSSKEIAKLMKSKWDLINGGILVCNPIPSKYSLDYNKMENVINKALIEAENKNIKGKETTPFLLSKIVEMTNGKSLESNIELVFNNAKLAANIAKDFHKINR